MPSSRILQWLEKAISDEWTRHASLVVLALSGRQEQGIGSRLLRDNLVTSHAVQIFIRGTRHRDKAWGAWILRHMFGGLRLGLGMGEMLSV